MNDTHHISDSEFMDFHRNSMKPEDITGFLEHISSCDSCADRFAASLSEDLITAPKDMKSNILKASIRSEISLVVHAKRMSKQMQLFLYSLKVGTATVLALLLLVLTMNYSGLSNSADEVRPQNHRITFLDQINIPLTTVLRKSMDDISTSISDFSNRIINMEVINHD